MKRIVLFICILYVAIFTIFAQNTGEYSQKQPESFNSTIDQTPPETLIAENAKSLSFSVRCKERNADVFIDNIYYGTTPFTTTAITPGFHSVRIVKDGFYPRLFHITIQPETAVSADILLIQRFGFLSLQVQPADSSVYIDDILCDTSIIQLPVGHHHIKIKKFGYTPVAYDVYIYDHATEQVQAVLVEAPFSLNDFTLSRNAVNPDAQFPLSSVHFLFNTTAAGSARIEVLHNDTVIWEYTTSTFTTWDQSVEWDSKNLALCDNGLYTVRLIPIPIGNVACTVPDPKTIIIDRSLRTPIRSFTSGTGSIGQSPAACIMPKGFFEAGISGSLDVSGNSGQPWTVAMHCGGSICNWLEAGGAFTTNRKDNSTAFATDVAIKAGGKTGKSFLFAGFARMHYEDGFSIATGIPIEYASTHVCVSFAPQFIFHLKNSTDYACDLHLSTGMQASWKKFSAYLWIAKESLITGSPAEVLLDYETVSAGIGVFLTAGRSGLIISAGNNYTLNKDGDFASTIEAGCKLVL